MNEQIEIRQIEPVRVACIRFKGNMEEANKVFPAVFKSIRGKAGGAPFFCYYEMNPETRTGELDLCVPTAELPDGRGVEIKELPAIKAVCLIHIGSYETLPEAYRQIDKYAAEYGIRLQPPFREVFIKGPGMLMKGNPDKYVTEIQFPIGED